MGADSLELGGRGGEEPPKLQITSLPTLCQWRAHFQAENRKLHRFHCILAERKFSKNLNSCVSVCLSDTVLPLQGSKGEDGLIQAQGALGNPS